MSKLMEVYDDEIELVKQEAYEQGCKDERKKFVEWCKMKGYTCYDWRMLLEQYEAEQSK